MAKLPQIQRSSAAMAQTITPGQAAAPHIQKIKLAEKTAQMIVNVNDTFSEISLNNANADHKQADTNFKNMMATRTEPFDQAELDLMGIGDKVDASGGPVAKWEVYSHALARHQEDMREKFGDQIRDSKDRAAWRADTIEQDNAELERAVQTSATMAVEEMANEQVRRAGAATLAGNWDLARQAYDAPIFRSNPGMIKKRDEAMAKIDKAEYEEFEQNNITDAMVMADAGRGEEGAASLEALAAEHRTGEKVEGSPWTDKEHNAWANKLDAQAKAIRVGEKVRTKEVEAAENKAYDEGVDRHWQEYYDDPEALLTNMPAGLKDEDIRSIVSFSEKTAGDKPIKTNTATWDMLTTMAANDPEAFSNESMQQYRDQLSTSDYKAFRQMQLDDAATARGEGLGTTNFQTNSELYNVAFSRLGFTGTGQKSKDNRYALTNIMAAELSKADTANRKAGGEGITLAEKQKIIEGITLYERTVNNKRIVEMPFEDMDDEDMASISTAVAESGFSVTAASADAANELLDNNVTVNRDTMIAAQNLRSDGIMINDITVQRWIGRARELGHL